MFLPPPLLYLGENLKKKSDFCLTWKKKNALQPKNILSAR
jgi:hypothetical protein